MIKNVIFDCGRVLIQYDEHYIASHFTEKEEDIDLLARVGMARKYWNAFDEGLLTSDIYKEEVKKELPPHLHEAAAKLCDGWTSFCPPVPGIDDVVRAVKESGKKLYLLSNFNKRLRSELDIFPILKIFDALVISGEIKMVKPNADIYEYILKTYTLDPDECIFIDDNIDNIAACEKAGIHGYLFDGDAEKLHAYLKENNIID